MNKITRKLIIQRIFLTSFAFFLSFFIAEGCIRLFIPFYNPAFRAFVREEAYRGAQTSLRVSRGAQIILRKSDFERGADIVCVGDSMTFGSLAKTSEAWPALLAEKTGLRVMNLGVGSLGPCAYNYMIRTASANLSRPPFLIIYTVFANDIMEGPCPSDYSYKDIFIWEEDCQKSLKLRARMMREWIFQRSVLYHLAKRMLTFGYLNTGQYYKPIFFSGYVGAEKKAKLEFAFTPTSYWKCLDMKEACVRSELDRTLDKIKTGEELSRKLGSGFILVLMPFKEQVYTPWLVEQNLLPKDAYDDSYDLSYDELVSKAGNEKIDVVDLRPQFKYAAKNGAKLYWTMDGHLTPEGHRLVASVLVKTPAIAGERRKAKTIEERL